MPGDEAREEHRVVDPPEVEHLDAEEGARDRRAEDRREPGADAADHEAAPVLVVEPEESAKRLVMAAPIWAHGPSLPTEPPKASVRTVAGELDRRDPPVDLPRPLVDGGDDGLRPVPRASGAKVRMSQTQAGSASGRRKYGRKAPREDALRRAATTPRATRGRPGVPQPTQRPATGTQERPLQRADEERGVLGVPAALVRQAGRLGLGGGPHPWRTPGRRGGGGGGSSSAARARSTARAAWTVAVGSLPRADFIAASIVPELSTSRRRPAREPEDGAATVPGVAAPREPAPALHPSEDSRERAGVQVEDLRQLPRGDRRKASEHADDEALGAGQAQRRRHPLRPALQAVVDRPEQPHELEGLAGRRQGARLDVGPRPEGQEARSRRSTSAWART